MKRFFLFLFLLSPFIGVVPLHAQECSCAEAFNQAVEVYEKDYSLFKYKVTAENQDLYTAYTRLMRKKAEAVEQIEDCQPVLKQWLQFFRDGHNSITYTAPTSKENRPEQLQLDRKKFEAEYRKKGYKKQDLPGIWKFGPYEVAIMPAPKGSSRKREYVGVILSSTNQRWKPGQVKFELTQRYGNEYEAVMFRDDYSGKTVTGRLSSPTTLEFLHFNEWTKVWPGSPAVNAQKPGSHLYSEFHIRMLDGGVPYIRFPNFWEREPAFVDSLLKAHHADLLAADFIIVDVRDNNGGNDVVYHPVLPYVLSGPVQIPNMGTWMSEGNLALFMEGKNPEEFNEEDKAEYDYLMSLKNTDYWYGKEKYARTYTPDTVFAPEQKVAVLINKGTISSGETFVYRAMQSEKVVLYGQNTAGIVDGFMVMTRKLDCFELRYPTSYRAKDVGERPVDPYGFAPDVYLGPEVDVLDFSLQHMRQLIRDQNASN